MKGSRPMTGNQELKIVLIGNAGVGKTCIVRQVTTQVFNSNTESTLGATYSSKVVNADGHDVRLQIWDTAGQEKYRGMAPMYFRDANAAIITYSITDKDSFNGVDEWVSSLHEHASSDVNILLVANKDDLEDQRVVQRKEGEDKASSIGCPFYEVSAKTGIGIQDIFIDAAKICLSNGAQINTNESIELAQQDVPSKKKGCC